MRRGPARSLLVYGTAHALTDALCAAAVIRAMLALRAGASVSGAYILSLALVYNFLAFAMQLPLGMLLDRLRTPRAFAGVGLLLCAAVFPAVSMIPEAVVVLCGMGNALFHLGGGAIALTLSPGKAGPPGIFVAPGAVGLFLGFQWGMHGAKGGIAWAVLAATACLLAGAMTLLPLPEVYRLRGGKEPAVQAKGGSLLISLAFALAATMCSIAIRSYVGLTFDFPWRARGFAFACALAVAGACGKALGGLLADRIGFVRLSCGALLAAIPLILLGRVSVIAGLAGSMCFQMTMAVTLLTCLRVFPGREGTAFGLNCLALFVGSLPLLLPLPALAGALGILRAPLPQAALIFASVLCLWRGLRVVWHNSS